MREVGDGIVVTVLNNMPGPLLCVKWVMGLWLSC